MTETAHDEQLASLREAAAAAKATDRNLVARVRGAVSAGVSVTLVAETIGRSRPHVYKMLSDDPARADVRTLSRSRWGQILDEALVDLLGRTGEASAHSINGALSSRDLQVKARRYRLAVANAHGMPALDSIEWAIHADASDVARQLERES